LDVWLELRRADVGCLVLGRPDGHEESFGRGLAPLTDWSQDGATLRSGAPFGREGSVLQIVAVSSGKTRATLLCGPAEASWVQEIDAFLPLIQRAILRLAHGAGSPLEAAAQKAWFSAPQPMLLLETDLTVVAGNPAAYRRLGIAPGQPTPPWLERWFEKTLKDFDEDAPHTWSVRGGDAEYNLSVLSVDPSEATPGRWLISLVRGGPSLSARIVQAGQAFGLTPREREALELLAEGLSNRQIAAAIDVTESTVKFHLVSVMRKAGVASRTELLARLHALHLADPDQSIPPDAQRVRAGWVWKAEDGIVHCSQDLGTTMIREDVVASRAAVVSHFEGTPLLVYSDATGVVSSTREAQSEAGTDVPEVAATAIRGGSAVSRALVNLYLRIHSPQHPTRLFRDRDAALQWLETFRS
jgi:DNA-binding CsgD family transcriptional regulator